MALPPLFDKLRLPVVGAPQFIIANPELVIAQCKGGIVGGFPALNARPQTLLDDWLYRIKDELAAYDEAHPESPAAPYAVNQIVHKTNERLDADVAACVKHKAPIVITSLGARPEVNEAIHSYGGIVLHDVININFAKKALEKGADGLIAVAAGAGGHAGSLSPIAFIHEIREFFDGPLLLSGAIATGKGILAAQAMGADLAYMGSAFIATTEANAPEAYKQMIVDIRRRRHRLFQPLHRRARQLSQGIDQRRRPRSRQPADERSEQDEFRRRLIEGEGLEGHLGRGPGRRRRA